MRARIRVHPGARTAAVGGAFDGALVVRVKARAVDGRATAAALSALAEALGTTTAEVRLVSGATSRSKVVEFDDEHAAAYLALLDS